MATPWYDKEILRIIVTGDMNQVKRVFFKSDDIDRLELLTAAAMIGRKSVVELLLIKGASVNRKDGLGNTALISASTNGYEETVELLLNNGAFVGQQNIWGKTALMEGSFNGHVNIVEMLLKKQSIVDAVDENGNTALHMAIEQDTIDDTKYKIVDLLLKYGASTSILNCNNKSPLDIAKIKNEERVIEIIRTHKRQGLKRSHDEKKFHSDEMSKEIEKTKNKLKKLEALQFVNKREEKFQEIKTLQEEVLELRRDITEQEKMNGELEGKLMKGKAMIKTWKTEIENKRVDEQLYKKLQEDINYFKKCIEDHKYDEVVQLSKRECPICCNQMRPNRKIYQCLEGHIICEECFEKICKKNGLCPTCRINIGFAPIRNRALEQIIENEMNN